MAAQRVMASIIVTMRISLFDRDDVAKSRFR